ncbi:hypothetical protein [Citrobacter portucalensis]|uniref:hypothetical protein n=1 Tax=Citrobacter portucalensis TaxID=1639133 RepID=UPI001C7D7E30|nr:hypothetical protein [Citrobacter portucalensis]
MGFPSPASDYVETRLTVDRLCQVDANCRIIETSAGFAVINTAIRPSKTSVLCVSFCGRVQFAVQRGKALIVSEGEAVEGEALDDVTVMGVVTFLINRAPGSESYDLPVM